MTCLSDEPSNPVAPQIMVALRNVITGAAYGSSTPPLGIYRSEPVIVDFFMRNGLSSANIPSVSPQVKQPTLSLALAVLDLDGDMVPQGWPK